jgi:hypothetical protein
MVEEGDLNLIEDDGCGVFHLVLILFIEINHGVFVFFQYTIQSPQNGER